MTDTILIVDDEVDLLKLLEFNLRQAGFDTLVAETGARALSIAAAERPDLILLDLMLPDLQGTEVCRQLRAMSETAATPIIMVTAKAEEIDRVVGFELGTDDYVVKPFSPRELVLRVKALLRRSRGTTETAAPTAERLDFGPISVDLAAHRVTIDEEEVPLTALEFRLLATFLQRRGRVQSRQQLLDDVWGVDIAVTNRTVDTHVKRLREKLGESGRFVETVRGVGYRFSESSHDETR